MPGTDSVLRDLSNMSPAARNPRGKIVGSQQRVLIVNTYKSMMCKKKEKNEGKMPTRTYLAHQVAEEVGISVRTALKVIDEYLEKGSVSSPNRKKRRPNTVWNNLDEFCRTAIRLKVHSYFRRNELPTLNALLRDLNADEDFPTFSRTTLYR